MLNTLPFLTLSFCFSGTSSVNQPYGSSASRPLDVNGYVNGGGSPGERREVILTTDQTGAAPLECVFNGVRTGVIAEQGSDIDVSSVSSSGSHVGSGSGSIDYDTIDNGFARPATYIPSTRKGGVSTAVRTFTNYFPAAHPSSRSTRKVICPVPQYMLRDEMTRQLFVSLLSPNATWQTNSVPVRILRSNPYSSVSAPSVAGLRTGWHAAVLPVFQTPPSRGTGSGRGSQAYWKGEPLYCRAGNGMPPARVTTIAGQAVCVVPKFFTASNQEQNSNQLMVSVDKNVWAGTENADALLDLLLEQRLELHEMTPSIGSPGQKIIVRGNWPSFSRRGDGENSPAVKEYLAQGGGGSSQQSSLKDVPAIAGCAFGDRIVPASVVNDTAVSCIVPPLRDQPKPHTVLVGVVLSQPDLQVFFGRQRGLHFTYFPRVIPLELEPRFAPISGGGVKVKVTLDSTLAGEGTKLAVWCKFGDKILVRGTSYGRNVVCEVPPLSTVINGGSGMSGGRNQYLEQNKPQVVRFSIDLQILNQIKMDVRKQRKVNVLYVFLVHESLVVKQNELRGREGKNQDRDRYHHLHEYDHHFHHIDPHPQYVPNYHQKLVMDMFLQIQYLDYHHHLNQPLSPSSLPPISPPDI